MPLRVFNTLTNEKQEFTPLRPGRMGLYVCGITVYDLPHIGHARMLTAFDVAVRYLRWAGWEVAYVRNWTDVDDKIIRRAQERGQDPKRFAAHFIEECRKDMQALKVLPADAEPKATEHVPEMQELIARLIERGNAYASQGDVYFSVRSFPGYGKLSKRHLEDLRAATPGEPASVPWDSPWGPGRPGWHIECSAMSQKFLGTTFDVHGGGKDLVFPHHENEIAQSEAASGQELARFWLHNGFVNVDSEKMSKSLGNFRTIRDLLTHWDGEALRAFLLSTQYRHPINFSESAIVESDRRGGYFYESLGTGGAPLGPRKVRPGGGRRGSPRRGRRSRSPSTSRPSGRRWTTTSTPPRRSRGWSACTASPTRGSTRRRGRTRWRPCCTPRARSRACSGWPTGRRWRRSARDANSRPGGRASIRSGSRTASRRGLPPGSRRTSPRRMPFALR